MKNILTLVLFVLLSSFVSNGKEINPTSPESGKIYRIYNYRLKKVLAENENTGEIVCTDYNETALNQLWRPISTGGSDMSFQNMYSGRYIQHLEYGEKQFEMGYPLKFARMDIEKSDESASSNVFVIHENGEGNRDNYFSCSKDLKLENGQGNREWQFEYVKLSDEILAQARERFDQLNGMSKPEAGKIYRIYNKFYGTVISEDYTENNKVICTNSDQTKCEQLWRMVGTEKKDVFIFQNILTGKYLQNNAKSDNDSEHFTGEKKSEFLVQKNEELVFENVYGIQDGQYWLNTFPGGRVVNFWHVSDKSSEWQFKEIAMTEEEIAKAQADYKEFMEGDFLKYGAILKNLPKISASLEIFYDDKAATTLKEKYQKMSDEQLRAEMLEEDLPEVLVAHALKIKNQSWQEYPSGTNWEKKFRIQDYNPHSNNDEWQSVLRCNFFSQMSNPTGINVNVGDILYVYVEDCIPDDGFISLYFVIDNETGQDYTEVRLNPGLNIIKSKYDANICLDYLVSTVKTSKFIRDFPNIKVRIEGGTVNGYFDLTKGDKNSDWKLMQKDGLCSSFATNFKSKHLVYHLNSELIKEACPEKMEEILSLWDYLQQIQNEIAGLTDEYFENFSKRFNCVQKVTSHRRGTYMDNGIGIDQGTISEIFNYEIFSQLKGEFWGPVHEMGHNHQQVINMSGCGEVSNNLLSNICVWKMGRTTTRGGILKNDLFDVVHNGGWWLDIDIFMQTRMYWQLYLYFTLTKGDVTFYPRLYAELRKDPLIHKNPTDGADDHLKFAKKVCDVVQMDLSEYFEAWGFFVPIENFEGDDYGKYNVFTSQKAIDEAIAYMHKYPKANGNIVFIDDRIDTKQPAEFEGASALDYRTTWIFGNSAFGKDAGDVGQYTDFRDETVRAEGYTYTLNNKQITINPGKGAVGFKVKDSNGKIVYRSNKYVFELPYGLYPENYHFYAAQCNGEDVEIYSTKSYINRPEKANCKEGVITWKAPKESDLKIQKYLVYKSGKLFASVDANTTTYTLENKDEEEYLQLTAVYSDGSESEKTDVFSNIIHEDTEEATLSCDIDGSYIKFLRQMIKNKKLVSIDLKYASIVEGGEPYLEDYRTSNDELGEKVFEELDNLETIILPESITRIGGCALHVCHSLKEVVIPDNVVIIERDALCSCEKLERVTVGRKAKKLSWGFCWGSDNIKEVFMKPMTPPEIEAYTFSSNPIVHVYSDVLEDYKATAWNEYNLVGDLEDYIPKTEVSLEAIPSDENTVVEIYTLDGKKVGTIGNAGKGIYIIRTKDGKTKKVMTL